MTDKAGGAPAFGLDAFAYNGYVVRINIGQVAKGHIRITFSGKPGIFSRQPFQRAVGAHMNHRVRLPGITQPFVIGKIMIRRRAGRIVDNLSRVVPKAPGRLHADINIPVADTGHQQRAFMTKHIPRRFPPLPCHFLLHSGILFCEPFPVFFRRDFSCRFCNLAFRQETPVIGKTFSNFIDQFLSVIRQKIHPVPRLFHSL